MASISVNPYVALACRKFWASHNARHHIPPNPTPVGWFDLPNTPVYPGYTDAMKKVIFEAHHTELYQFKEITIDLAYYDRRILTPCGKDTIIVLRPTPAPLITQSQPAVQPVVRPVAVPDTRPSTPSVAHSKSTTQASRKRKRTDSPSAASPVVRTQRVSQGADQDRLARKRQVDEQIANDAELAQLLSQERPKRSRGK